MKIHTMLLNKCLFNNRLANQQRTHQREQKNVTVILLQSSKILTYPLLFALQPTAVITVLHASIFHNHTVHYKL